MPLWLSISVGIFGAKVLEDTTVVALRTYALRHQAKKQKEGSNG